MFNTSKRAFFYLPFIKNEIYYVSFYSTDQAYILNNPNYPERGEEGYIVAYRLNFDSDNGNSDNKIAEALYTFTPSNYVDFDFAISSFIVSSTSYVNMPSPAPRYVTELFLLDGFGKGILYLNFNSTFVDDNPVFDFGVFDLASWLVAYPQNAYVDSNTEYYRLKNLGYAVSSEYSRAIEYQFIVTTSNTAMYRIGIMFDVSDNKTMKRPIVRILLYQIYNNYGSMILNTNDVHNYNKQLVVRMFDRYNASQQYIGIYDLNL